MSNKARTNRIQIQVKELPKMQSQTVIRRLDVDGDGSDVSNE